MAGRPLAAQQRYGLPRELEAALWILAHIIQTGREVAARDRLHVLRDATWVVVVGAAAAHGEC